MYYGAYPSLYSTLLTTPRFKTGPRGDITNYRPINLTSVLSIIMEKSSAHSHYHSFFLQVYLVQHRFMTKHASHHTWDISIKLLREKMLVNQ